MVQSIVLTELGARRHDACARDTIAEAASLSRTPDFANLIATGLACAQLLPGAPCTPCGPGELTRAEAFARLEPLGREALAIAGTLPDDRSGIYEALVDARTDANDPAGAKQVALEWLSFLEQEAAAAPTPLSRSAFDSHRVVAALHAGVPGRIVPALEASEREVPGDYNAPARLAIVFQSMGRLDEAQAAIERALRRAYGPRTLRLLETKAGIETARGDRAAAHRTLELALRTAEALPPAQHRDELVRKYREKLR